MHPMFADGPEVIEESLSTSDANTARRLLLERLELFESQLAIARGISTSSVVPTTSSKSATPVSQPATITREFIEAKASDHFLELVSKVAQAHRYRGMGGEGAEEQWESVELHVVGDLFSKHDHLKAHDISAVRRTALLILANAGLLETPTQKDRLGRPAHPVESEYPFKQLCSKLIDAELDAIRVITVLFETGKPDETVSKNHMAKSAALGNSKDLELRAVANRYLETAPKLTKEWRDRVVRIVDLWYELKLPTSIRDIQSAHVRSALDKLIHCPANRTQRFPSLTLEQAIEKGKSGEVPTLSANTLRDGYLAPLKTILSFAEERGLVQSNVASKAKIAGARKDARGTSFNANELNALFGLPLFVGCKSETNILEPGDVLVQDHRYWGPLLALFTGARTAELAQLYLSEVHVGGVLPYLGIQATEGRTLKTSASRREVPINPLLIEFGFDHYVETLKLSGQTRLFPQWEKPKGKGYADAPSQRFFRRSIIPQISNKRDPKPTFHSFRNTMKGEMARVGVPEQHQNAILGHEQTGMSRIYLDKVDLASLAKSMHLVTFENVNFDGLRARSKAGR